jgi:Leucine-rich repeat (LRR) protein
MLPPFLKRLHCAFNRLCEIRCPFPHTLKVCILNNNWLTNLPPLPGHLVELDVSFNQLTQLSMFPWTLEILNVRNNHLTQLHELPEGLQILMADNNDIKRIYGWMPPNMSVFTISNNCVERLPIGFYEFPVSNVVVLDSYSNDSHVSIEIFGEN